MRAPSQPASPNWRVSPLLKLRMMFGMPWIVAIGLMIPSGSGVFFFKFFTRESLFPLFIVPAVIFGLMIGGAFYVGYRRSLQSIGILEYGEAATAEVVDVATTELPSGSGYSGSTLYTLHLRMRDDTGLEWDATYNAGILGDGIVPGTHIDTLFDVREPTRVLPLPFAVGAPTPGDDGVIHCGKPGEAWGFVAMCGTIALAWLAVIVWGMI